MKNKNMKKKKIMTTIMAISISISLVGCGLSDNTTAESTNIMTEVVNEIIAETTEETTTIVENSSTETSMLDTSDLFTDRDLEQEADISEATYLNLESNQSITITEEGVYVITGEVSNSTIVIETDNEAKVQIVLDGVSIVNEDAPAIYVKTADKVFVTTTDTDNVFQVNGDFDADGETNLDAVIYSKSDLVLNGLGTLTITSNEGNGVTSKDDLKITGGTFVITAKEDGIEANDSICIYNGNITVVSEKDGLHCENDEESSLGYIYIQNGNLNITAADDAIHGTSIVQIDGGNITIPTCVEGIEATYILINNGTIDIYSTDDGMNATSLSDFDVAIEINGGDIIIVMASGDTDAFDSNGDIYVNGGNFELTCGSSFDANGTIVYNAGTVVVNGETVTELQSQEMGGKGRK